MGCASLSVVGLPRENGIQTLRRGPVMRHDDPSEPLRIEIDTHQCDLPPTEIARLQDDLDALTRMVENFPKPELRILVEHNNRSNDFSVKTTLLLPGATLVASDHNQVMHA